MLKIIACSYIRKIDCRNCVLWNIRLSKRDLSIKSYLWNFYQRYVNKPLSYVYEHKFRVNKKSEEPFYTKKLDTRETQLYKPTKALEPGFIVIDLETDGLISKSKKFGIRRIPQILQIGFAPLEELAHRTNTVSFHTQPIDPIAFNNKIEKSTYLQRFYISYYNGSYFVRREGGSNSKVSVVPLKEGVTRFVRWKRELYKDRPVYLIAHNALKFDKIVLEHQLRELMLFDTFQSQMNLSGWIDSLSIIRRMPNILRVLGYPYMTENGVMWFIRKERPFSLTKLVEALSKRYEELSKTRSTLQWPIFLLSYLNDDRNQEWLHHFSRDVMIHENRDLLKQLKFHQSRDDVMALVCILHQLNLYPKFRRLIF